MKKLYTQLLLTIGIVITTHSVCFAASAVPKDADNVGSGKDNKMEVVAEDPKDAKATEAKDANTAEEKLPAVKTVGDLPALFAYLVGELAKQPIVELDKTSPWQEPERCKRLYIEKGDVTHTIDCEIFDILAKKISIHETASGGKYFTENDYWRVHPFLEYGTARGIGLSIDIEDLKRLKNPEAAPVQMLEKAYRESIKDLISSSGGLCMATLHTNPEINEQKNENDWVLLIPTREWGYQGEWFMQKIIIRFNLSDKIMGYHTRKDIAQYRSVTSHDMYPSCDWTPEPEPTNYSGPMYFWVKRQNLDEVVATLQLKIV